MNVYACDEATVPPMIRGVGCGTASSCDDGEGDAVIGGGDEGGEGIDMRDRSCLSEITVYVSAAIVKVAKLA